MSMPISKPGGAGRAKATPVLSGLLALGVTAACEGDFANLATPGGTAKGVALDAVAIADGAIVLRGPAGYCVDAKSVRARGDRQFALLAQCDLLNSGEVEGVTTLSVLTVTAVRSGSEAPLPSAQRIAAPFGPTQVLNSTRRRDIQLVQLSSGGDSVTELADPVHWRGVFRIAGYTLGLAAYSAEDGEGSGRAGLDLLLSLADNIRKSSTAGGTGDTIGTQRPGS